MGLPAALLLLLLGSQPPTAHARTLCFVTLLYRHGDRAPMDTYPSDPHKEGPWPQGFQQLTQVGVEQQRELGQFLRQRYEAFLSPHYHPQEIYVRSTDYDRTLASAQANLAGLYPPGGAGPPNPAWQPVPVHTVPAAQDKLLRFPLRPCPRYQQLMEETTHLPQHQARMHAWKVLGGTSPSSPQPGLAPPYASPSPQGFLEDIANLTGLGLEWATPRGIWKVYDALRCQQIHGLQLPAWATPHVLTTLGEIVAFNTLAHVGLHQVAEKARLTGGVLLDAMLQNFSEVTRRSLPLRMVMYSGHDSTLIALLAALGLYRGELPPYAACLGFEFYQESNSTFSVGLFYRNESGRDFLELVLPGCPPPCPLERFTHLTQPVRPTDRTRDCGCAQPPQGTGGTVPALAVTVAVLGLAVLGLGILHWHQQQREGSA
ncbi:testicular acid phosphatase isoform X1 [Alligator mississippiensis]|uniref:testicular acid phosphatase isoform X1 n=1 Tax=Alligator mississippiensis TaxID=8496 RepID=UPI0009071600|nr:testicular acid phosphatase isoform X1 [Alligator mississippiensis]